MISRGVRWVQRLWNASPWIRASFLLVFLGWIWILNHTNTAHINFPASLVSTWHWTGPVSTMIWYTSFWGFLTSLFCGLFHHQALLFRKEKLSKQLNAYTAQIKLMQSCVEAYEEATGQIETRYPLKHLLGTGKMSKDELQNMTQSMMNGRKVVVEPLFK